MATQYLTLPQWSWASLWFSIAIKEVVQDIMAATVLMTVKHQPPLLPILLFLILVVGCSKYYKRRDLLTLLPFEFYLILERGGGSKYWTSIFNSYWRKGSKYYDCCLISNSHFFCNCYWERVLDIRPPNIDNHSPL